MHINVVIQKQFISVEIQICPKEWWNPMMFDMVYFIILILIQDTQGIFSSHTCLRRVIQRLVSVEKSAVSPRSN